MLCLSESFQHVIICLPQPTNACPLGYDVINVLQILRDVDANDATLTSVAMSHSGRMLFAGTATGTLRSYKFPLTVPGEWTEYQGHGSSISKVS